MNAPFRLEPTTVPTVERPAFKEAMALAKSIGKPNAAKVRAWAAAMKKALG